MYCDTLKTGLAAVEYGNARNKSIQINGQQGQCGTPSHKI